MRKKALIAWGGWDGHEPKQVSEIFKGILENEGYEVELSDTLTAYDDLEKLMGLDLIVPCWTMSTIEKNQLNNVLAAVESGVGLAGCHGGMCDSFRQETQWQFMTGAQWVAHPGNQDVTYSVNIKKNSSSPIISGISDFDITSEQYYIHVDPCVNVLATTRFPTFDGPHSSNGAVDIPVAYTKMWGKGKVFYSSLGHVASAFDIPEVKQLMHNGFLWASK